MNNQQKEVLKDQLNKEKKVIEDLKNVYQQALDDCCEKIRILEAREDMNDENIQSVIYQKRYQEALRIQLEGILSNMHSNSYELISDYLSRCYKNGYTGVMYDLMKQGIPLIIPIDQEAVTRAIQLDTKLSKPLYESLGEDVDYLKKATRWEISRGISSGLSWSQVAGNLARNFKYTPFNKAYNNSVRIARTEGHRIQIQSAMDAQEKAKEAGADIVKQWDATMDGRTRPSHRQLDGQIREIGKPFELGNIKVQAPGMFGSAAEDCNCRCALLQRAKWALDEDELETLRKRASYHGLAVDDSKEFGHEKAKDFSDYQKKYLKVTKELDEESLANIDKSGKIILDRALHTRNDPMVEVMGAAIENNKEELQGILSKLNELGVEVEYRTDEYAYEIIGKGKPGRIIIDKYASLSAWLHEYQHAIDDSNAGWSSIRIMKNPAKRFRREQKAYQVEIDLAKKIGNKEMVIRLEKLMEEERKLIYGE